MRAINELCPRSAERANADYLTISGWEDIQRRCAEYLHDESRLQGERVEVMHFPATTEQAAAAVRLARSRGHRVAVSGGRTGIVGGAVPMGAEEIISLEKLIFRPRLRRDADGNWYVRLGAGTTIDALRRALDEGDFECEGDPPDVPLFYPVDTTERSAEIGGTIATNASGARTLYYGPTRNWVSWMKVVVPDGRVLALGRGEVRSRDGELRFLGGDGRYSMLSIPEVRYPPTKHTAGYYLKPDMDAIDLFIGSEGTLGIVTEAELRLIEKPPNRLFLTLFLDAEHEALDIVKACKQDGRFQILAMEYFGPNAIELLRQKRAELGASGGLVSLPETARMALYLEFVFEDERGLDALHCRLLEMFDSLGIDPEKSWAGFGAKEMEKMKELRHAVPEAVNTIIGQRQRTDPTLHKVGTDMAVPRSALRSMMKFYRSRLEQSGLDYVIFGHIGDGHLHVNILPEAAEQVERAKSLYLEFAREVVRNGGSVAAEHGIGRIKKMFLPIQYRAEELAAMRRVKQVIDPLGTLNPGVLF